MFLARNSHNQCGGGGAINRRPHHHYRLTRLQTRFRNGRNLESRANHVREGLRARRLEDHVVLYRVARAAVDEVRVLHERRDVEMIFGNEQKQGGGPVPLSECRPRY